jgi:hypothetical protein
MQKLALEIQASAARSTPVLGVSADRMADSGQVSADLVRAPRLQPEAQQRGRRQALDRLEMGDGVARPVAAGGHHGAAAPVASDRGVDRAGLGVHAARDEGQVLAAHLARAQLGGQRGVGLLGLRHDEQPRRVAVEAVDDAGPLRVGAAGDAAAERLRQRRPVVSAGGMRDQPGGLVDHEQVGVLVDDLEFGRRVGRRGGLRSAVDLDQLTRCDAVVLRPRHPVHQHGSSVDQSLGCRARRRGAARGQEGVQAQPGVVGGRL